MRALSFSLVIRHIFLPSGSKWQKLYRDTMRLLAEKEDLYLYNLSQHICGGWMEVKALNILKVHMVHYKSEAF